MINIKMIKLILKIQIIIKLNEIESEFLKDINSKNNIIPHITTLAERIKSFFKSSISLLGDNMNVKGHKFYQIKIISKLHNHSILTKNDHNLIKA